MGACAGTGSRTPRLSVLSRPENWRPKSCIKSRKTKTRRPNAGHRADSFEDLAARYLKYAARKNKSWKQAEALVRKYLLPRWAKLRAMDVTRSDVKAMVASIAVPIMANQVLASASAIFTWAIKEEFAGININPCVGVERNATTSRERVLSASEIPLFWAVFDSAGLVESSALKMILLLGQRPGEVRSMRSEHIIDGWWTLSGQPVPKLKMARHQK